MQAGIAFTLALTLQATVRLAVPGALATPAALFGVYVAATATHTLVNMLPIHWIGLMNRVSIFWCVRRGSRRPQLVCVVARRQQSCVWCTCALASDLATVFLIVPDKKHTTQKRHIAVTVVFCAALPAIAPTHPPARFVFAKFHHSPEITGVTSPAYSLLLSALMSQFTLTVRPPARARACLCSLPVWERGKG